MASFAALLLADGRFPAGGHVHSAGVESAVADGRIVDGPTLEAFVVGRLHTSGLTDAALTLATVEHLGRVTADHERRTALLALDDEAHARLPAPALREASRRLGRQLVRVAGRCWPSAELVTLAEVLPGGAHLSVAFGTVAVAAGLEADDAARLCLHHLVTTAAQGALRLLGLDPFEVAALTARLATEAEAVVTQARSASTAALADLPAGSGPVVEIAAVEHRSWDGRLFAT